MDDQTKPIPLLQDDVRCRWKMLGDPDTVFLSDTRRAISEAMQAGKETIGGIVGHTGLPNTNVRQTLRRMVAKGQAKKLDRGCYTLVGDMGSNPVTTVTLSQTPEELVTVVTEVTPPRCWRGIQNE
ncbi:MAG: hypothetical protein AAED33_05935 [Paracoccaceae bacterium]